MREILRKVGFFMLGIFSLLYVIFVRNFAEIRVQITFLNFPVFIGEILLFICLVLSFFVFDFRSIKGWKWGVVFYFVYVIAKALLGYGLFGPLAFRHAALFYYLIFIFFAFIFYRRDFLSEPLKIFIVFVIFTLCLTRYFNGYWILALWSIAFILIRSLPYKRIKYFFYIVFFCFILFFYRALVLTSRTFIVGNIVSTVFLILTFLLIAELKVLYKIVIAGGFFILLAIIVFKYSYFNASGSILDIKTIMRQYSQADAEIKDNRKFYVPQKFKEVKLFNPEQPVSPSPANDKVILAEVPVVSAGNQISQAEVPVVSAGNQISQAEVPVVSASNKVLQVEAPEKKADNNTYHIQKIKPKIERRLDDNIYPNILFRLFIWRDMIVEFSRYRPILGFPFGKPLRSESLEILKWGCGDWARDGWIEPHNSYLNILYRMGILGIALLGFLIWQFCNMVKSFITFKSTSGILLCSILINWLIASNFLPLLELPYNAIPFWVFWGVTLGYLEELKTKGGRL